MSAAIAAVPRHYTAEEYLAFERASDTRHEFIRGRMIEMAGASEAHNLISHNIGRELGNALKDRPCKVYQSDMRVRCPTGLYAYPDVVVACGGAEIELDDYRDTLLNPIVIVEVLSPSTEARDRGEKFENYRWILSLRDYFLVSQDRMLVERFSRAPNGARWMFDPITDAQASINFPSIDCSIPMAEFYRNVDFSQADPTPRMAAAPVRPAGE